MSLPTKPRLEGAIKSILAPMLREDGYLGSGRTYRRVRNNLIQVINVQGSMYGGRFAVNLAVQPHAVADFSGEMPNPKTIDQASCILRTRLALPGESDHWWDHEGDEASMDSAMGSAAKVYASIGREMMERISEPKSPIFVLEPMQLDNLTGNPFLGFGYHKFSASWMLAQLRMAHGDVQQAHRFALIALSCLKGINSPKNAEIESFLKNVSLN